MQIGDTVETKKIRMFGDVGEQLKQLEKRFAREDAGIKIKGIEIQGRGYDTYLVITWEKVEKELGVPMFEIIDLFEDPRFIVNILKDEEAKDPLVHGQLKMTVRLPAMRTTDCDTNFGRPEEMLFVRQNNQFFVD